MRIALILLTALLTSSFVWPSGYDLLDSDDFELENASYDGITNPADWNQKSPIRWVCTRDALINISCELSDKEKIKKSTSEEDDDERAFDLMISAEHKGQTFDFRMAYYEDIDICLDNYSRYSQLLSASKNVCFFAAYLPEKDWSEVSHSLELEHSEWEAYGLKTENGEVLAPIFTEDEEP